MSSAAATASIMMTLACMLISVSAALTEAHLSPVDDRKLFPIDPHVKECWESFSLIPGCVEELFTSFATGTIGIGPACCEVINEIADKCFPKFAGLYPFTPFLASLIKAHCQNPPAPAPLSPRV